MDTVIQDLVLGAGSMPPHVWMTAAGGLTITLLIFLLRPRKKVVPASRTSDADTGTPVSEKTNHVGSNHVGSNLKSEEQQEVENQSSEVKCHQNEIRGENDLKKDTIECEIITKESQALVTSAVPQIIDDDEDLDASLRSIEDQLMGCHKRIKELEKELGNERSGRKAAQDWTTLLEKELEAHISARKATEDRCSRLAHRLREARRTLKHSQRRCSQLEKLIAEHTITPAITLSHHDSSTGDSFISNDHEEEVEMDSLEDSDSGGTPYNHRKDSLEEMVQGNITASRKSSRLQRLPRNSEFRRDSLEPEMYQQNLDASPHSGSFFEDDDDLAEEQLKRDRSQDINERVVLPGDFSSEEEEVEEEYLDEDEEELYGMDSDSGLPTSGRIEDFELSRDVMDVIISNVQGDLPDMLDQDGDNDSLSDLLQDNLAAMDGEEVEELSRQGVAVPEVSAESIGDTKRTKKFWEEIIASDQPGQDTGGRRGSSEANGLGPGRRTLFQAVKGQWERSYTPDSLHGSEEAGAISGSDGSEGSARVKHVLPKDHSTDFASIRKHWDTANRRKSSRNSSDSEGGHPGVLSSRIESMKQHWEKTMSESPSPKKKKVPTATLR